jgi:Cu+-exporting ATPase
MWGMGNYQYLFADKKEYDYVRTLPKAEVSLVSAPAVLVANSPSALTVSLKEQDGRPATLFVDMERYVHLVVVSRDQSIFAHIHAKQTPEEIRTSTFSFDYIFPKAGEYLVSVDYAHGLTLESKQFTVKVGGAPAQRTQVAEYASEGIFGGYTVALKYALPVAGKVETLRYTVTKDGKDVTELEQYLSAAMHISVVKNDLSAFLHLHGEVHPPGAPLPPVTVKNGQVVHSMAQMMSLPARFGPNVDAHLIFPSSGLYTVWGEFKAGGRVIPTAFTVRVEE